MKKEPIIFMSLLGAVGYITFHGHSFGKDCWLFPYKGIAFATSSVVLGVWLAVQETD